MRLLCAALLLLTTLAVPAAAQEFRVVSSLPANASPSVPLADSVRFTFSDPLGPDFATATVALFLPDSVQVDRAGARLSADGRTVAYPVTHPPGTDVVALVLAARSASGDPLALPYALNYSTATNVGAFSVSGTLTVSPAGVASPRGSVIALVNVLTGDVAAAAVAQTATGAYQVRPVRAGLYLAFALRLPDLDAATAPLFGFHDPDNDGTPDPVLVFLSSPSNVGITLRAPAPVAASAGLAAAVEAASGVAEDQALVGVFGAPVDAQGRSPVWAYDFYSPTLDAVTRVIPTVLVPVVQTLPAPASPLPLLPNGFVDSPAALATAEAAGGSAFRAQHPDAVATVRGGRSDALLAYPDAVWEIVYRAPTADSLALFVDMATGALVDPSVSAESGPLAEGATLGPVFPNPVAGRARVPFGVAQAGPVSVRVYDVLGREVARLVEGPLAAGPHEAVWEPSEGLASGVYVVRLAAGAEARSVRVLLAR